MKSRLYSENKQEKIQASFVLNYVLGNSLKLLHPFMPFVTSEIYSNLANYDDKELIISKWPEITSLVEYNENDDIVEKLKEIIVEIRNVRAGMNIHPSKKSELIFVTQNYEKEIEEAKEFLLKLGFGDKIIIQKNKDGIDDNAISILKDGIEVYIPFEGLVDIEEEKNRLEQEKTKLKSEVERCEKMLSNPGFVNKAPQSKIEEEKAKLEKYQEMLKNTEERLKKLCKK